MAMKHLYKVIIEPAGVWTNLFKFKVPNVWLRTKDAKESSLTQSKTSRRMLSSNSTQSHTTFRDAFWVISAQCGTRKAVNEV